MREAGTGPPFVGELRLRTGDSQPCRSAGTACEASDRRPHELIEGSLQYFCTRASNSDRLIRPAFISRTSDTFTLNTLTDCCSGESS